MALPLLSQTISPRVKALVNSKGDTIIQMSLVDARIVLTDILSKKYSDSLIVVYTKRDSTQSNSIILQKEEIKLLKQKFNNQKSITENLNDVLINKDIEINILNETIKKQKKEIRKQKVLKIMGFTASVVLPIITILLMTR